MRSAIGFGADFAMKVGWGTLYECETALETRCARTETWANPAESLSNLDGKAQAGEQTSAIKGRPDIQNVDIHLSCMTLYGRFPPHALQHHGVLPKRQTERRDPTQRRHYNPHYSKNSGLLLGNRAREFLLTSVNDRDASFPRIRDIGSLRPEEAA